MCFNRLCSSVSEYSKTRLILTEFWKIGIQRIYCHGIKENEHVVFHIRQIRQITANRAVHDCFAELYLLFFAKHEAFLQNASAK
jgi:hypothetical protein